MKEFIKSAAFKVIIAVAAVLIGLMIYSATTGGFSTVPETVTGVIVTPVQTAFSWIGKQVTTFFGNFGNHDDEIGALQEEINALRGQLVEYDDLKRKNEWYEQMLGLYEQHTDYTFAHGTVIARDPAEYYGEFTINAGTLNGVEVGDPVVTAEGVVGMVQEVGPTFSRVRTILDPDTHAAAAVSRTGDTGYTSGSAALALEGRMRLNYLERTSGIIIGDTVVTSGLGGIFPKGLLIGKVTDIHMEVDGNTMYAELDPFVAIHNVSEVMVITSFDGQGEVVAP